MLTRVSILVQNGKLAEANQLIDTWPTILSTNVSFSGVEKVKALGTVLHVSKTKKLQYIRTVGKKKMKKKAIYHRLVFCRLVCIKCLIKYYLYIVYKQTRTNSHAWTHTNTHINTHPHTPTHRHAQAHTY